jgi:hypothetical protein
MDVTLEEARLLLARARVDVSSGPSPARAKVEQRSEVAEAMSFGRWATRYFEFKSDAKAAPSGSPTVRCRCVDRSTTVSWRALSRS